MLYAVIGQLGSGAFEPMSLARCRGNEVAVAEQLLLVDRGSGTELMKGFGA